MLLVGVMGVSMTACSGNGDTASSGESSSAENSSAASASEELPEPVELNIASFRVGTHNAAAAETRYVTEFQELYNGVDKHHSMNFKVAPVALAAICHGKRSLWCSIIETAISSPGFTYFSP